MKVIKVDELNKVLDNQLEKLQDEIDTYNYVDKNKYAMYINYLEGKLRLIQYINNVIEILQFEIKE